MKGLRELAAVLLLVLPAWAAVFAADTPADAIIARVNGEALLLSQLREATLDAGDPLTIRRPADLRRVDVRAALTVLIDETLLVQRARREEIEIPEERLNADVGQILAALRERHGGEAAFGAFLAERGLSWSNLRRGLLERERRRALAMEVVARKVTVDTEALGAFRARRRDAGRSTIEVQLAQILIAAAPAQLHLARERAFEVARAAGAGPERFAELAADHSDDPATRRAGGEMGWIDPLRLLPPLREAVGALRIGEVSAPVASERGWHILRLLDRRGEKELAFAELFEARRSRMLERLRRNARIEVYAGGETVVIQETDPQDAPDP